MSFISHIMVASTGLELTVATIKSLRECSHLNYEIIVIDNASNDGTSDWLKSQKDIKTIRSDELICYSAALNLGLHAASKESQHLSILNNDLVFTDNWDGKLTTIIDKGHELPSYDKIGIAGPMSNAVGGLQKISMFDDNGKPKYTMQTIDNFTRALEDKFLPLPKEQQILKLGFLSGFCWVMSRECWEAVGDFHEFKPLGFEDNDYILRANEAGFASVAVLYSFVHHLGGQTTQRLHQEYAQNGMINRLPFYKKFAEINDHPMKLVAGYRVKNVEKYFERSLKKMSEIADEIVVFDDHSTDQTVEIAKKFNKVKVINKNKHPESDFNEARDREKLLQLCKERNPDWIIIQDGDEEFEEKFDRAFAEKLMRPIKPHITGYIFRYITHWDSENLVRADGAHGRMAQVRMFKNRANLHVISDHPQGFHCSAVGNQAIDSCQIVPVRVRHYGYVDPEERKRKFEWYQRMDTKKDRQLIGGADYRHLLDINVQLLPYNPNITLGLTMIVKDEEPQLTEFLDLYHAYFDEMIIVDTGSSDKTKEVALFYGAKVFDYTWSDNFSAARNFAKSKSTCSWVFHLDPDESLQSESLLNFYRYIEEPVIGYMFNVVNFLPNGKFFLSESLRLYKNLPEIKYSGPLHESIRDSVLGIYGKGNIGWIPKEESITHFGYLKPPIERMKKLQYYSKISQEILKTDPNNAMAHYSIGLELMHKGEFKEAEEHFKVAMISDPMLTQSFLSVGNIKMLEGRAFYEHVKKVTNRNHPTYENACRQLEIIKSMMIDPEQICLIPGKDYRE